MLLKGCWGVCEVPDWSGYQPCCGKTNTLQCKDWGYPENCDKSFALASNSRSFHSLGFLFGFLGDREGAELILQAWRFTDDLVWNISLVWIHLKILWQAFRLLLLRTELHRYKFQTALPLAIKPVAVSDVSAESLYLFFCCLGSFTFSRISRRSDTLPDCNKCKWYFFSSLFLKCWFETAATEEQFAEVNIVQQSSYQQVCLKCWQRDVMNSL